MENMTEEEIEELKGFLAKKKALKQWMVTGLKCLKDGVLYGSALTLVFYRNISPIPIHRVFLGCFVFALYFIFMYRFFECGEGGVV